MVNRFVALFFAVARPIAITAQPVSSVSTVSCADSAFPTVNLGYVVHQASLIKPPNTTVEYYNFSNIRYAAPPIGSLRFSAPEPPVVNHSAGIQDGSIGFTCPQMYPGWLLKSGRFGELPNIPASEDCLFLDVVVPSQLLNISQGNQVGGGGNQNRALAPVLVWIYGGGFEGGDKNTNSNPIGILEHSTESTVFVSFNYRLGAFGFLSGSSIRANGTANAGLYDQRLALQWVQKYIHLFGGDPRRVTVMGESAGGLSIIHQITAYGGLTGASPFQQAIILSPGFSTYPGHFEQEQLFEELLAAANATSLEELRTVPEDVLIKANQIVLGNADYGAFPFAPVIDGSFVPDMPGNLFLNGQFDQNLNVMVGHNSNEGLLFVNPTTSNETGVDVTVDTLLPMAHQSIKDYVVQELYPPIYNGSLGYKNIIERVALIISEAGIACNTNYANRAFGNKTHSYLFAIPPGTHGQDGSYVFFNAVTPAIQNVTVANAIQAYITQFISTGSPEAAGFPSFPTYGSDSQVMRFLPTEISVAKDPTANPRCLWWQKGLYT